MNKGFKLRFQLFFSILITLFVVSCTEDKKVEEEIYNDKIPSNYLLVTGETYSISDYDDGSTLKELLTIVDLKRNLKII